jgi:hypothetical protein
MPDDHVLLGGEVAEERALGHLDRGHDLVDGRLLVPLGEEEVERRVDQRQPGALLLAFAQARQGAPGRAVLPGSLVPGAVCDVAADGDGCGHRRTPLKRPNRLPRGLSRPVAGRIVPARFQRDVRCT